MSALKFINSSNQQKSSTKQSLHNNQNLGHTMYQKLFQIRWANTANQFGERCQHFVSHSFNALRTLLTKHPAKRNYKEPTRLETNSKNILSKTKTVNLETKFQYKIKIGNILCPEFGNELLNAGMTVTKKNGRLNLQRLGYQNQILQKSHPRRLKRRYWQRSIVEKNKACSSQKQFWVSI